MNQPTHGALHHIWGTDLDRVLASLGWLLQTLGYTVSQSWDTGRSWLLWPTYLLLDSPLPSPPTSTAATGPR
ncbi:hypothetical protein [Streptomyces sp. CoH17]|uniref:hypothetical protein n=1 Tax=Streptomyces sp. CoH17 TaxID=2992806 RepID=UPI002D1E4699|nr:hypothetical protein [Streptomyces sp. CoH17]